MSRNLGAALNLPADGPAVVLLHYEELHRHEQVRALAAPRGDGTRPFDALIFDEAHAVKERLSGATERGPLKRGAWLLRQAAAAGFGITATPLINELYEPVSLLQLAKGTDDPELGRRLRTARLRDRVDVMEFLLSDSLRRTKTDVLREIPPRDIRTHEVIPSADQLTAIRDFLSEAAGPSRMTCPRTVGSSSTRNSTGSSARWISTDARSPMTDGPTRRSSSSATTSMR